MSSSFVVLLLLSHASDPPSPENWCRTGQMVMIPDGREGPVIQVSGDICKVLVYGESRVSLWAHFLIEPVYPEIGH